MNRVVIEDILVQGGTVKYQYMVEGEWSKFFLKNKIAEISYDINIEKIPESILVVPFICNIIPIVWLCDAQIYTKEVDRVFVENLPLVKSGYQEMYPMLDFGEVENTGIISELRENLFEKKNNYACFFSGGVDAYTTLFRHLSEKPMLVTLWGSDIKLDDEAGWEKVWTHISSVAEELSLSKAVIKSNFRDYIDDRKLNELVALSKDGWWHGFQHGIGLLGHAAPLAYYYGLETVYIASSFPESMKGLYTCASDPTIDNYVKYGECSIIHDGYEMNRQDKVAYLVKGKGEKSIQLRVCWESSGGSNCCRCEKCYRTILEIVSEGGNPNEYGFSWTDKDIAICKKDMKRKVQMLQFFVDQYYLPIQKAMRTNKNVISNYNKYRWFVNMNFDRFNYYLPKKIRNSLIWRIKNRIIREINKVR